MRQKNRTRCIRGPQFVTISGRTRRREPVDPLIHAACVQRTEPAGSPMKSRAVPIAVGIILIATLAVACKKAGPQGPPVPEVGVIKAHAESVPLTRDLVGRLSATRAADARARVAGVLL